MSRRSTNVASAALVLVALLVAGLGPATAANKGRSTKEPKSVRDSIKVPPRISTTVAAITTVAPTSTPTTLPKGKPVQELLVAAASDLRPAFEELGTTFTAKTGTKVKFSFGSSGQLSQQIRNGAPFDVFASADAGYVNDVLNNGIGDASTKATYAYGRLALWVPARTQRRVTNILDLADPAFTTIAIANPEHAPYGAAAVQALKSTKLYELLIDRLVYGENVSDAYRLATSGNADAALVSLSLVIANRNGGRYIVIPKDAHAPLEQTMVVTATGERVFSSTAFTSLVTSDSGRDVMRKYGFLLPADPSPGNSPD